MNQKVNEIECRRTDVITWPAARRNKRKQYTEIARALPQTRPDFSFDQVYIRKVSQRAVSLLLLGAKKAPPHNFPPKGLRQR